MHLRRALAVLRAAPLQDGVLIALFAAAVAVPLLTVGRAPWDADREHRLPAPAPAAPDSWRALLAWPRAAEAWLADHAGGHDVLGGAYAWIETDFYHRPLVAWVLAGPAGWLFTLPPTAIADFAGQTVLSDAEIAAWAEALRDKHDRLAAHGMHYYFLFAPNKESIYPEETPPTLAHGKSHTLDSILAYFDAHGGRPRWLIDPRGDLIARRTPLPTFHPLDAHWNALGAYIAYAALARQWQHDLAGFVPVVRRRADFTPLATTTGDLFYLATRGKTRDAPLLSAADTGPPLTCATPVAPPDAALHLPHPVPDSRFVCSGAPGAHRLLAFHDSMAIAMQPYLSNSFARTTYAWTLPDPVEIAIYAAAEGADVVLEERAEREIFRGQSPPVPLHVGGVIAATARGGEFAVSKATGGRLVLTGWAEWQSERPGRSLRLTTNLPIGHAALTAVHPFHTLITKFGKHDEARFIVQLDLDTAAQAPAQPRFCLQSSDPVLGTFRLKPRDRPALDGCPPAG